MSIENLAGQALNQYELRELLGAGGMGAVYRAYQPALKREVAVKVLPGSLANEPGYIERFTREAEIAASLEHPHIVPIYDYGAQNSISYVVMRMLTGGSLVDRQAAGKLPSLGEIAVLLSQLASALDYAHSQGVIHRDIKPSNVMFDNHSNGYLVDFGIAKLLGARSHLTTAGTIIGTPLFIAPELWKGDDASPASDQYALAVMIYELVTGQFPFEAPTPQGLIYKHLNEMPTPAHTRRIGASESITLVLERAMAKEPQKRFPTITAFAQAFEGGVQVDEDTPTQFLKPPSRRKAPKPAVTVTRVAEPTIEHRQAMRVNWLAVAALVVIAAIALVFALNRPGVPAAGGATEQTAAATSPAKTATALPPPALVLSVTADLRTQVWQSFTQTAQMWTHTPTATITPTPNLTLTYQNLQSAAIATLTATSRTPTPLPPGFAAVAHDADWQPVVQSFGGVDMALVPAGCFDMGSADGTSDEQPVNQQCFAAPFWMDRTEVTNGQFASLGGQAAQSSAWPGTNRPRETVTWFEARDFCALRGAGLPTEAEWEYAARGPDDLTYPWGNTFVADNAVYSANSGKETLNVGARPAGASWVGALDMAGNVWEWMSSDFEDYPYTADDGREDMTNTDVQYRTIRGGAWDFDETYARAWFRVGYDPTDAYNDLGFRCVRDDAGGGQ